MTTNPHFNLIGTLKPGRSKFDLSFTHKGTCDMGQLIPLMAKNCYPGEFWQMGADLVIRMQPLLAPILHTVRVYVHYIFVPHRLVMDKEEYGDTVDFSVFITGGSDGSDSTPCPVWTVTGAAMPDGINDNAIGSLWDVMGHPVGVVPTGAMPCDFPKRAYNLAWNWLYRDQFVQDEVDITTSEQILYRNYMKDYFTSALPSQELGTTPAISAVLSGVLNPDFTNSVGAYANYQALYVNTGADVITSASGSYNTDLINALNKATVDISAGSVTGFDIHDIRLSMRMQEIMERNQRAGVRLGEFNYAHFGVAAQDHRLQMPEFIGGFRQPIIVNEVVKTADDGGSDPLGHLGGKGILGAHQRGFNYYTREHGTMLALMSIVADAAYEEGIRREWWKDDRWDFYLPELANLSEQEVRTGELFANGVEADNDEVFGYQAAWDEYKTSQDMISGEFRASGNLDYWHISRQFGSRPTLNSDFLKHDPRKDCFVAPSEPAFYFNAMNYLHVTRPMPYIAIPSLV